MSASNEQPGLYIVRGPSAAGKSTVAAALASRLVPSIHINVDELHSWITNRHLGEEHVRLSILAAAESAKVFWRYGYSVFVDCVFLHPAEVTTFVDAIRACACGPIHLVTLTAKLTALTLRDNNRVSADRMGTRVATLYHEFALSGERRGYTLDTSFLDVEQTVARLLAVFPCGDARLDISGRSAPPS